MQNSLTTARITPIADSAGIKITKANGTTDIVTVDTTNSYVGVNCAPVSNLTVRNGSTCLLVANSDYAAGSAGSSLRIRLGATSGDTYGDIQAIKTGGTAVTDLCLNPSGGNVGIGTTTMKLKLNVAGGISFGDANNSAYVSSTNPNCINGGYNDHNDTGDLWLNYNGYQDGADHYRDLKIGDGKGATLVHVDGSAGNVGIGCLPAQKLHVCGSGSGLSAIRLSHPDYLTTYYWDIGRQNVTTGNFEFRAHDGANESVRMTLTPAGVLIVPNIYSNTISTRAVYVDSSGNLGTTSSSRRSKTNITDLPGDSDKILDLQAKQFNYIKNGEQDIGFIAEDIDAAGLTQLVGYEDGQPAYLKYEKIAVYLQCVVKKLRDRIEALETRLNAMEGQS